MKLGKLGQRLRQEAKRSPVKTTILALMCAVALYYWAPLLTSWFRPAKDEPGSAAVVLPTQTVHTQGDGASASSRRPGWDQLVQWMDADRYMQPVPPDGSDRDPFPGHVVAATSEEDPVDVPITVSPASAGLQLQGTMVGPTRSATINGRTYVVGESIPAGGTSFRLIEILPRRVIVENQGGRYPLEFQEAALPGGDVIQRLDAD